MGWKDWEGILIIGGLALVLGAILLVPALWWARRSRRKPESYGGQSVSGGFLAGVAVVIGMMLAALSAPLWAPETRFGQWLSSDSGRLTFVFAVGVAIIVVAYTIAVCAAVVRANFYSRQQKIAQCLIVLLLPLVGAVLVHWVYLMQHAEAKKVDRAFIPQQDQADVDTIRHHHRVEE